MSELKNTLISILMPVYNADPFLDECIISICNQTETHWELITVNDQSEDNSLQILEKWAKIDNRIKVFNTKEKGIIPALVLAFKASKGNLISRMDADDIMPINKMSILKSTLLKHGQGSITTGLVEYFSDYSLQMGYKSYEAWLNHLCTTNTFYDDIYKECVLASPNWLIYREDFIRIGGFAVAEYPEDYDFTFRLYAEEIKIIGINEVLHKWRDHPLRTSRIDPNYFDQSFFKLKLKYFFLLEYYHSRPIVLWGAGRNGKKMAKLLQAEGYDFLWVTQNEKKIDKNIYNNIVKSPYILPNIWQPQILICVSSPSGKKEIQQFLDTFQYEKNYHYFWFL